jgi:hypothetical protein
LCDGGLLVPVSDALEAGTLGRFAPMTARESDTGGFERLTVVRVSPGGARNELWSARRVGAFEFEHFV